MINVKFIISIIICQLAGIFDPIFTNKAIPNWYYAFTIPMLVPPNWIFGPVWLISYIQRAWWASGRYQSFMMGSPEILLMIILYSCAIINQIIDRLIIEIANLI